MYNVSHPLVVASMQRFSDAEIAKHNTLDNAWLVISGYVYDVTQFIRNHPGGEAIVREVRI